MKTERLTILVTPEQKRELAGLAKRQRISVGELVRAAVAAAAQSTTKLAAEEAKPSAEQVDVLERAADAALLALERAAAALDRAELELARTRAHFDSAAGEVRDAESTPRFLLQRALAKARETGASRSSKALLQWSWPEEEAQSHRHCRECTRLATSK